MARTSRCELLAILAVSALAAGCAYHVTPPANVIDPVRVVVVDYGVHSSLVLPGPDGMAVEYAYGQWDWFALNKVAWYRALPVLLVPGPAGLGRGRLSVPASADAVRVSRAVEAVHELTVERARVDALRRRLDAEFDATTRRTVNASLGLEFIPDPQPYSILYHCNTRVVDWLRALGCAVRGVGPDARFQIERAPAEIHAGDDAR